MRTPTLACLVTVPIALAACSSSGGNVLGSARRTATTGTQPAVTTSSAGTTAAATPGGGSAATGGSCAADNYPKICATVAITGSTPITGNAEAPAPLDSAATTGNSCAQLATDSVGGAKDLGDGLDQVGGNHGLHWDIAFTGYHGPGTYSDADLRFSLTADNVAYAPGSASTVAITVSPDFATKISFVNLASTSPAGEHISGSVSWTCVNPTG